MSLVLVKQRVWMQSHTQQLLASYECLSLTHLEITNGWRPHSSQKRVSLAISSHSMYAINVQSQFYRDQHFNFCSTTKLSVNSSSLEAYRLHQQAMQIVGWGTDCNMCDRDNKNCFNNTHMGVMEVQCIIFIAAVHEIHIRSDYTHDPSAHRPCSPHPLSTHTKPLETHTHTQEHSYIQWQLHTLTFDFSVWSQNT